MRTRHSFCGTIFAPVAAPDRFRTCGKSAVKEVARRMLAHRICEKVMIMKALIMWSIIQLGTGCAAPASSVDDILGKDSFTLSARYGTPASYQIQGHYMQLNYGSDATGCRLIVLIDQDQRVAGWVTSGKACETP